MGLSINVVINYCEMLKFAFVSTGNPIVNLLKLNRIIDEVENTDVVVRIPWCLEPTFHSHGRGSTKRRFKVGLSLFH
jgi:hypothetical protein